MDLAHEIQPAEGYFDLSMFDEAWEALDDLPDEAQHHPAVLEMRVAIRMNQERWEDALKCAETLCEKIPDSHSGFIHVAYCLHELGETKEAREKLNAGPPSLQNDPLYFYNLACYDAQLGETDAARTWLKRACKLDSTLRKQAKEDPDLEPLRDEF